MKLRPLGDRVVLKRGEVEEKTASGLFIAGANKEQPQYAEVVAVGPGALVDGKRVPMDVKVGDKVFFAKYGGSEIKLDGVEYIVIGQSDIMAVIE
ncbi:MAG: co-chaperone GroES [Firmicutes bacterium]|nr:co-chaperone GroES [Bacillota bacterium]MBQ2042515.1 co-chaperone GroES [Bacillota bacterium]MBQ6671432.1 co-chaperone GroES [Bacillota bacterium]